MDTTITNKPLVSVTICTFNRAHTIVQAIQSALDQTYENLEIIIVDDASTDNTASIIKQLQQSDARIHYFKNEHNLNIAPTRNRTVEQARGEFIAILDSDDYWIDKEKIAKQVAFLETHPDYALVGTQAMQIDQDGNEVGAIENFLSDEDIRENALVKNEFVHSSVLYRRSALEAAGIFNVHKSPFEDYDTILKIGRTHKFANLPDVATAYRVHAGGESKNLNFKKRAILLLIMLKNGLYYPHLLKGLARRLSIKR